MMTFIFLYIGLRIKNQKSFCKFSTTRHKLRKTKTNMFEMKPFMTGTVSQAGDADSSRAPGLTSGLQGFVNVNRGALLWVPQ